MKRIFSLALVLACVSLVAACSSKNPELSSAPAEVLQSLQALQAKAESGDAAAQFELGAMYHDGEGLARDFAKARQWFLQSAEQGDPRAEFNLGVMEYIGEGVKQNYKNAREWFEKSADQGNTRAQFNLGVMYYRGEGMAQNFDQAINYFTKAGSMGFTEAQYNLGVMYAKGEGAPSDVGQAYAWFEAARSFGHPGAAEVIKKIESELKPDEISLAKSIAESLKKEINARIAAAGGNAQ